MNPAHFLDRFSSTQMVVMLGLIVWGVSATITGIVRALAFERRKRYGDEARLAVLRDFSGKGMPTEEIERLIRLANERPRRPKPPKSSESETPAPPEIVADRDGDWVSAVLLKSSQDACLVHYVGDDDGESSWVDRDRIRFPVSALGRPNLEQATTATPAVANMYGEWMPALVLKAEGSRYYVHFIGSEDSENQWLDESGIRLPWSTATGDAELATDSHFARSTVKSASVDPEF